jgi:hypothetical protein
MKSPSDKENYPPEAGRAYAIGRDMEAKMSSPEVSDDDTVIISSDNEIRT